MGAYVLALQLVGLSQPAPSQAYETLERFMDPPREAGGGGRLFTGVPRDGYNCRLCHRGQPNFFGLRVEGLPEQGYVPGQTYEITVSWSDFEAFAAGAAANPTPEYDPTISVVVELGSESRELGAGAIKIDENPPRGLESDVLDMMLPQPFRCSYGTAKDQRGVELASLTDGKLTKELLRCAGTKAEQRCILHMRKCGAAALRFDWIAPPGDAAVWFSAAMVNTIKRSEDPTNDSVITHVVPVQPATSQAKVYEQKLEGQCSVTDLSQRRTPHGLFVGLILACSALWLHRRRKDIR